MNKFLFKTISLSLILFAVQFSNVFAQNSVGFVGKTDLAAKDEKENVQFKQLLAFWRRLNVLPQMSQINADKKGLKLLK